MPAHLLLALGDGLPVKGVGGLGLVLLKVNLRDGDVAMFAAFLDRRCGRAQGDVDGIGLGSGGLWDGRWGGRLGCGRGRAFQGACGHENVVDAGFDTVRIGYGWERGPWLAVGQIVPGTLVADGVQKPPQLVGDGEGDWDALPDVGLICRGDVLEGRIVDDRASVEGSDEERVLFVGGELSDAVLLELGKLLLDGLIQPHEEFAVLLCDLQRELLVLWIPWVDGGEEAVDVGGLRGMGVGVEGVPEGVVSCDPTAPAVGQICLRCDEALDGVPGGLDGPVGLEREEGGSAFDQHDGVGWRKRPECSLDVILYKGECGKYSNCVRKRSYDSTCWVRWPGDRCNTGGVCRAGLRPPNRTLRPKWKINRGGDGGGRPLTEPSVCRQHVVSGLLQRIEVGLAVL